jgi:hypothetical protein
MSISHKEEEMIAERSDKPTGSNQLSTSTWELGLFLKALIKLDFPTPLGPTITVV